MSERTALLVIDVQNDVVVNAHRRDEVVATIGGLVERARAEDTPVVWVQHSGTGLDLDTDGWQIVPELVPQPGEAIIHKTHRDSFEATDLADVLDALDVKRLIVTGSQTDFCVRWTLHGAQVRGYSTVLVSDGHTTDDGDPDIPTAAQLIEHTNRYWASTSAAGNTAAVAAAADVSF